MKYQCIIILLVLLSEDCYGNPSVVKQIQQLYPYVTTEPTISQTTHYTPNATVSPIGNPCLALQNAFAHSIGEFMECAGLNSSPIRFCMSCVDKFLLFRKQYKDITDSSDHDEEGKRCFNALVTSDKISVLNHIQALAESLWTKAYCSNCFASITRSNASSAMYVLRDDVTHFMLLNQNATACFDVINKTQNSSVCVQCRPQYRELDDFYEHMQQKLVRQVCMDVTDAMNRTRRLWSRRYACHTVTRDDLPVAVLSAFVLVFPAVFYIGNAVNGTRQRRRIVQQKRLVPRLRSRTAPELQRLLPEARNSPPPVPGALNPLSTVLEEAEPPEAGSSAEPAEAGSSAPTSLIQNASETHAPETHTAEVHLTDAAAAELSDVHPITGSHGTERNVTRQSVTDTSATASNITQPTDTEMPVTHPKRPEAHVTGVIVAETRAAKPDDPAINVTTSKVTEPIDTKTNRPATNASKLPEPIDTEMNTPLVWTLGSLGSDGSPPASVPS